MVGVFDDHADSRQKHQPFGRADRTPVQTTSVTTPLVSESACQQNFYKCYR